MIFGGTAIQTLILAIITIRCKWEKEVIKISLSLSTTTTTTITRIINFMILKKMLRN